ncbi:hypothetical protein EVAR_24679_1 [Eumeta japonica]|uniref:Uncharacterized protein n=1 Tax=Eumeta variegata TaxID=151549 RepID=A0A4C1WGV3_EUMVA|nr:hypothetical protein EVAR_24679_1 [Eumeta japonica]
MLKYSLEIRVSHERTMVASGGVCVAGSGIKTDLIRPRCDGFVADLLVFNIGSGSESRAGPGSGSRAQVRSFRNINICGVTCIFGVRICAFAAMKSRTVLRSGPWLTISSIDTKDHRIRCVSTREATWGNYMKNASHPMPRPVLLVLRPADRSPDHRLLGVDTYVIPKCMGLSETVLAFFFLITLVLSSVLSSRKEFKDASMAMVVVSLVMIAILVVCYALTFLLINGAHKRKPMMVFVYAAVSTLFMLLSVAAMTAGLWHQTAAVILHYVILYFPLRSHPPSFSVIDFYFLMIVWSFFLHLTVPELSDDDDDVEF